MPDAGAGGRPPWLELLRGGLLGLGAAAIVGFLWFAATVGTKSQLTYLALAVGIAAGAAVHTGCRRRGVGATLLACSIAALGCLVAFYFISRSALIRRGFIRLEGPDPRIPLRPTWELARDVLRVNLRSNYSPYVYFVGALGAAALMVRRGDGSATRAAAPHRAGTGVGGKGGAVRARRP